MSEGFVLVSESERFINEDLPHIGMNEMTDTSRYCINSINPKDQTMIKSDAAVESG